VAKRFSLNSRTYVSSDASDFSDTANVEYLALLAHALGAAGSVHYHGMLRIRTFSGDIIKSDTPLMGWKGTFDLASLLLAFSVNRLERLGVLPNEQKVQCGDDLLGAGSYEAYKEAYEFINCKLSEEKTVISKHVTIFCGEMFWRGLRITPVRFLMYDFGQAHKFIGKLINRTRDFIENNNYTTYARRKIYPKLQRILGGRYNGYLDFRLSGDLGGIPLYLGPKIGIKPYLETNNTALFCALRNIPFEKEDFDSYHECFSHLPLGQPYSLYGLGTSLSPGSWPKKKRATNQDRKKLIRHLWDANKVGIEDVLDYVSNPYMLLRS
jgi:hypothetical protein